MKADVHVALAGAGLGVTLALLGLYGIAAVIGTSSGAALGVALNVARPQTPALKGDREAGVSRVAKSRPPEYYKPPALIPPYQTLIFWEDERYRVHEKWRA